MTTINDKRTEAEKAATVGFVVFTDKFMSGWGGAEGGASFYALALVRETKWSAAEGAFVQPRVDVMADTLLDNGARRAEMLRARVVMGRTYRPGRTCAHLTIVGPTEAARWYEPGGF